MNPVIEEMATMENKDWGGMYVPAGSDHLEGILWISAELDAGLHVSWCRKAMGMHRVPESERRGCSGCG